ERIATVTGVAMVPLAAQTAFSGALDVGLTRGAGAAVAREVMIASGAGGMIGGQLLDLESEGKTLDLGGLERIHRGKTGALIRASALVGGMAARAADDQLRALGEFGEAIGLAFQIADDVLDITQTT